MMNLTCQPREKPPVPIANLSTTAHTHPLITRVLPGRWQGWTEKRRERLSQRQPMMGAPQLTRQFLAVTVQRDTHWLPVSLPAGREEEEEEKEEVEVEEVRSIFVETLRWYPLQRGTRLGHSPHSMSRSHPNSAHHPPPGRREIRQLSQGTSGPAHHLLSDPPTAGAAGEEAVSIQRRPPAQFS